MYYRSTGEAMSFFLLYVDLTYKLIQNYYKFSKENTILSN